MKKRKSVIPSPMSMFETIKSFVKTTNMTRKGGMNVPMRLLHVDLLIKIIVKKSIFDIQLVNEPVFGYVNAQDDTNGGGFESMIEIVIKIKARLLRESLCNQATFVAINIAFCVILMAIEPVTSNNVCFRRRRRIKIPCLVGLKRKHFIVHSRFLVRVTKSLSSRARDGRDIRSGG